MRLISGGRRCGGGEPSWRCSPSEKERVRHKVNVYPSLPQGFLPSTKKLNVRVLQRPTPAGSDQSCSDSGEPRAKTGLGNGDQRSHPVAGDPTVHRDRRALQLERVIDDAVVAGI